LLLYRRFVLKDSIYRQRIRALAVLTEKMLKHYVKCGVSYVEFSVGVGDLFERPWIYKQLVAKHVDGIEYNFLGAFPRDRITFWRWDSTLKYGAGVHASAATVRYHSVVAVAECDVRDRDGSLPMQTPEARRG
jgi:hypothetical protein